MYRLATAGEVESLARLGYAARGLVYGVVGWFAILAARGRSSPTDSKGALAALLDEPFGALLLCLVALGLVAYAVWRVAGALLDVDGRGRDAKALAVRAGQAAAGALHLGLAAFAVSLLLTGGGAQAAAASGGQAGDLSAQDWTAWLLAWPFGRWLVAAVGVAVAAAGFGQFAKAWTAGFRRHLAAPPRTMRVIEPIGRAGFAAKGVVFVLVGLFFLTAAWQADASESGGLGQALRTLQDQPYGPWLLGVVAVGLLAFGLFSAIQAVYRRIDVAGAGRKVWRAVA